MYLPKKEDVYSTNIREIVQEVNSRIYVEYIYGGFKLTVYPEGKRRPVQRVIFKFNQVNWEQHFLDQLEVFKTKCNDYDKRCIQEKNYADAFKQATLLRNQRKHAIEQEILLCDIKQNKHLYVNHVMTAIYWHDMSIKQINKILIAIKEALP